MSKSARATAVLACLLGFTGVLLAALGAHAVPGMNELSTYQSWQSANILHLVHAAVLLILAIQLQRQPSRLLLVTAAMMFVGIALFSGSIYLRILLDLSGSANIAPLGGFMLMAAWLLLPLSLLKP